MIALRRMGDASSLGRNITTVLDKIRQAAAGRNNELKAQNCRLVCASKTKSAQMVLEAYRCGQQHFGENYVTELVEKSYSLAALCPEMKWHFIGHLQSNKVKKVLECPNLYMIETIDSMKLADKVNNSWSALGESAKLNIMVQVNTSGEAQKYGIPPDQVVSIISHVREKCQLLHFSGLMTIGSYNHDYSTGPNPDFIALMKCKQTLVNELKMNPEEIEISMGMSNDFEYAINMGSTSVRVGSSIFGTRDNSK